jgi:hypothetical protein
MFNFCGGGCRKLFDCLLGLTGLPLPTKPNDNENGTPAHGISLASGSFLPWSLIPAPMVLHFLCVSIVDDVVVIEFLGILI